MARLPYIDYRQMWKDFFLNHNRYELVTDYVIRDGNRHPFAIIVPGGGYIGVCSFVEGTPVARQLNDLGISAFILHYRTGNKGKFPNPMDDLARAVTEVLEKSEEYNVITDNYSVWGFSAGGHLAASFGTENMGYRKYGLPSPGAIILGYPVITMHKELTHKSSHDVLIGKQASETEEEFTSVEKHVDANYPPTFIWCGTDDKVVSTENTRMMVKSLEEQGIRYETHVYDDVGHGIGIGTGTNAEEWLMKAVYFWLQKHI